MRIIFPTDNNVQDLSTTGNVALFDHGTSPLKLGATLIVQSLRSTGETREDRRDKPRINVPFHVKVDGVDDKGTKFSIETVLDNLSGNGLYLRMVPCVLRGAKISIVLGLHTASHVSDAVPRFLIEGVVLRTEEKTGGICGTAVSFDRVRFL